MGEGGMCRFVLAAWLLSSGGTNVSCDALRALSGGKLGINIKFPCRSSILAPAEGR